MMMTQEKTQKQTELTFLQEMFLCDCCRNKYLGEDNKPKFGKECPYYKNCVEAKLNKLNGES